MRAVLWYGSQRGTRSSQSLKERRLRAHNLLWNSEFSLNSPSGPAYPASQSIIQSRDEVQNATRLHVMHYFAPDIASPPQPQKPNLL